MGCCNQVIATNAGGIPYIISTNTTIGTENINIALGARRIQPIGYISIMISDVIPADTTTTLPINLTLNDVTKALTLPNGTQVTAEQLLNVGNIVVFNDRTRGLLTLVSRTVS